MTTAHRGRPRRSSKSALEEAATELFFEQGVDATTVDDIAGRAGVSRATFFNYFPSKASVLWVDVDRALADLELFLASGMELGEAVFRAAKRYTLDRVPLIATQSEAMRVGGDLAREGGARVGTLATLVARSGVSPLDVWVVTSALVGAGVGWVGAGSARTELSTYLGGELTRVGSIVDALTLAKLSYTGE